MRDGIYKGLKLGRKWNALLKRCEREADRGQRANEAAVLALDDDVRQGLPPRAVEELRRAGQAIDRLLPGFDPAHMLARFRAIRAPATPFADLVARHMFRLAVEGSRSGGLFADAVRDAYSEWRRRRLRQIEECYMAEGGAEIRRVLESAKAAMAEADRADIVGRVVRGDPRIAVTASIASLDDDLLKGWRA